ncbi:MAG: hypothetical protein WAN22_14435 [Solirubrobacteraceae bacterium]
MDGDVLVSVEHDDGVAGIVDHGEFACLSGCLGEAQTVLRGYFSSMEGLTGERSAEGGLLAPGAVGAERVPEVGGDWEATPWLRCVTCGYAEGEPITLWAVRLDDLPPANPGATSG